MAPNVQSHSRSSCLQRHVGFPGLLPVFVSLYDFFAENWEKGLFQAQSSQPRLCSQWETAEATGKAFSWREPPFSLGINEMSKEVTKLKEAWTASHSSLTASPPQRQSQQLEVVGRGQTAAELRLAVSGPVSNCQLGVGGGGQAGNEEAAQPKECQSYND